MGLNDTPLSERKHIAFFGCRNAGKSSLLNAVTGQKLAIVSDVLGTTTDPVYKSMELLPAGPVVVIDTPGLDDVGDLGKLRVEKAVGVLNKTDLAILVADAGKGLNEQDKEILSKIKEKNLPVIVAYNKTDLTDNGATFTLDGQAKEMNVSALNNTGIYELKEAIAKLLNEETNERPLVGDLVNVNDLIVLVVPIDKAAPKGRLILPQQQTIRDLLDNGAVPITCRDSELEGVINKFGKDIKLVITDSQAFGKIKDIVPRDIPLTSFSILFSRYKGELEHQLASVNALDELKDGDTILISEGCTHHRQCGDIGTEKIPKLLSKLGNFNLEFTSGTEFPTDLRKYKVIIHCGACMLNDKEMKSRIEASKAGNVAITNYGMTIAKLTGILDRSIEPLKTLKK